MFLTNNNNAYAQYYSDSHLILCLVNNNYFKRVVVLRIMETISIVMLRDNIYQRRQKE